MALKSQLDPQDFCHTLHRENESVRDFIRRLERTFQLAYGRDNTSTETWVTLSCKRDCATLSYSHQPFSGAQTYSELCLAAKDEEKTGGLKEAKKYRKEVLSPNGTSGRSWTHSHTRQTSQSDSPTDSIPPVRNMSKDSRTGRKCYIHCNMGNFAQECSQTKSTGRQDTEDRSKRARTQVVHASGDTACTPVVEDSPLDCLFSSGSEHENGEVKRVQVSNIGSKSQEIEGVPWRGIVNTGSRSSEGNFSSLSLPWFIFIRPSSNCPTSLHACTIGSLSAWTDIWILVSHLVTRLWPLPYTWRWMHLTS